MKETEGVDIYYYMGKSKNQDILFDSSSNEGNEVGEEEREKKEIEKRMPKEDD